MRLWQRLPTRRKAKLPECNGRVDSAVKLVLAGDVELLADGTAKVASQSNGTTAYHVVNGHCDCQDFAKAHISSANMCDSFILNLPTNDKGTDGKGDNS